MSALERRLTALERRPERLSWTICAVIALQLSHVPSSFSTPGIGRGRKEHGGGIER